MILNKINNGNRLIGIDPFITFRDYDHELINIVDTMHRTGQLTNDQVAKSIDAIKLGALERDFFAWLKYFFPGKFDTGFCEELHGYLYNIADKPSSYTIAPRGHAKTTIMAFAIPIYYVLTQPGKFKHFMMITLKMKDAIGMLSSIRLELENNDLLRLAYGDQMSDEKWTQDVFVLKNGSIFSARSIESQIRGANYRNIRPDWILMDDIYGSVAYTNPRSVAATNEIVTAAVKQLTTMIYRSRSCIHYLNTAISQNDLFHVAVPNDGSDGSMEIAVKKFPAIRDDGSYLWNAIPTHVMDQARAECGSIIFAREYLGELWDGESQIIRRENIHEIDKIPDHEKIIEIKGFIDPSTEGPGKDFTGICVRATAESGKKYIIGLVNKNLGTREMSIEVAKLSSDLDCYHFTFEAIGAFFTQANELIELLSSIAPNITIKKKTSVKGSKIARLIGVQAQFENDNVYFLRSTDAKARREVIDQLITNEPVNDDIRDAVVMSIEDPKSRIYVSNLIDDIPYVG